MSWVPRFTCCTTSSAGPRIALGSILLALLVGCQLTASRTRNEPGRSPVLRRMQQAYPDLANGRFVSLADFEVPGQVELFRTVGAERGEDREYQPTLSILRSRGETGAGSLKASLASSNDRLLMDGERSRRFALIRDWRPYALLLMSIHGPRDGAVLEFSVISGERRPIRWSHTIHVRPGWNLLRLDVDTIGDHIDLADVRALSWQTPPTAEPIDFYLDDLILTDNTRHVLAEDADPGQLYVYTRGRRIHVGVGDRFQLALADGVIAAWRADHDLNLCDVGGLGPWPVPLPADWATRGASALAYDNPALFADWGALLATSQSIVEATPFRVVIEGRWRFTAPHEQEPAAKPTDALPGHTWRYVIYPTGQVHVWTRSDPPASGWAMPRVGFALGLDGRHDFREHSPPPTDANHRSVPLVLLTRAGPDLADLLWTWPADQTFRQQRVFDSADGRRLAVLVGDIEARDRVETAHLLRFWPRDLDARPEAESIAADFQNPVTLSPTAGRLLTDVPGDLNHDGYNESEGCYELEPADGVLRFEFDPGHHLRFDPVFRVHQTAARRCWVYARGRRIRTQGRDAEDNLLFRLGRVVTASAPVEIHTAPPPPAP